MNRLQTSMNHSCLKADTCTKRHNMDAESTKQVLPGAAYFELYIFLMTLYAFYLYFCNDFIYIQYWKSHFISFHVKRYMLKVFIRCLYTINTSLTAQLVKNPPAMKETPAGFLGRELLPKG